MNRSNLVQTAVADGRFTTLASALQDTDLVDTLTEPGPFTVFAPTDQAFADLNLDRLSTEQLRNVLLYHVVSGYFPSSDLESVLRLKSVEGSPISVRVRNGEVYVNGNRVQIANIKASNGVIHVLDTVLMPTD